VKKTVDPSKLCSVHRKLSPVTHDADPGVEKKPSRQLLLDAKTAEAPPRSPAFAAFFETLHIHSTLACVLEDEGARTLEDLAAMEPADMDAAVGRALPVIASLLSRRAKQLRFTRASSEEARAGNRRDFMVALPERVGDADDDSEAGVEREVRRLFELNPGKVQVGSGGAVADVDDFWRFVDSRAFPGMGFEENRLLSLFKFAAKPLARSMERSENTYANVLHRGYTLLAARGAAAEVAVDLHQPLHTFPLSLCMQDGGWETLLEPDETGFRGFTSFAPTRWETVL
jgi:hypothetical protein